MKLWIDHTAWTSRRAARVTAALSRQQIESIAVIKHAALGDMILTRPFLIALRGHFPNAKITLSVVSHYQQGVPADLVDRVHVAAGKSQPAHGIISCLWSFCSLGAHDLLFDLTGSARSFWITLLNRARLKTGFIPRGAHKFSHHILYDLAVPRSEYKFEAETFLDQLNALGIMPAWPLQFNMPGLPRPCRERYLLYFVSASAPYKCWPAENFTALITHMRKRCPEIEHVVLPGINQWERERAAAVAEAAGVRICPPADGQTEGSWTWIQNAELLVANDTGIRNYAVACGVPTVGVFIETLPFRYLPRFGRHAAVYEPDGGGPDVTRVIRAVEELLLPQLLKNAGRNK